MNRRKMTQLDRQGYGLGWTLPVRQADWTGPERSVWCYSAAPWPYAEALKIVNYVTGVFTIARIPSERRKHRRAHLNRRNRETAL